MKKKLSNILNFLQTTYLTEDQILIYKRKVYLLWNNHNRFKENKILYYCDSIIASIHDLYGILHDDEEGYKEHPDNDDELEMQPDIGEIQEDNYEDVTYLEEVFEDVLNLEGVAYPCQNKEEKMYFYTFSNQKLIPKFYYEILETEVNRWETSENELLGGAMSTIDEDDNYYAVHSSDYGTFIEHWITGLFFIPLSLYTSVHQLGLVYALLIGYIFYKRNWESLRQTRVEESEEDFPNESEEDLLGSPIKESIKSMILRAHRYLYSELPTRIGIALVAPFFLPVIIIPIASENEFFGWKEIRHLEFQIGDVVEGWITKHVTAPNIFLYACLACFVFTVLLLPANPLGHERAHLFERDSLLENMEPEWRDQYNIVRVPHVTWPSKLGTQLKLEGPVTCDLDWMTYKALREQWQIWTKAFSYYLLDNTKKLNKENWMIWYNWSIGKRMKEGPSDLKFDDAQFSTSRLPSPFIFKFVTNIMFSFTLQEPFQKWDGCHLREREVVNYEALKEGISRGRRVERDYPWLSYGEENLLVTPGAYATFKKVKKMEKTRKRLQVSNTLKEFLEKFEAMPRRRGDTESAEMVVLLPTLTNYIDWAIRRSENIKKKMEKKESKRDKKRVEIRIFPWLSKVLFYVIGKIVTPIIFLSLKVISFYSSLFYIIRMVFLKVYEYIGKPIEITMNYVVFPVLMFLERRIRGVFTVYLFPLVFILMILAGRNNQDFAEEEDGPMCWGVDHLATLNFPEIVKKRKKYINDPLAWIRHMYTFGKETSSGGSRPLAGVLQFYDWYFHWYRRDEEGSGSAGYRHGILLKEEEKGKIKYKHDSYEERKEEDYVKHIKTWNWVDWDVEMSQKGRSVRDVKKDKRTIFDSIK